MRAFFSRAASPILLVLGIFSAAANAVAPLFLVRQTLVREEPSRCCGTACWISHGEGADPAVAIDV